MHGDFQSGAAPSAPLGILSLKTLVWVGLISKWSIESVIVKRGYQSKISCSEKQHFLKKQLLQKKYNCFEKVGVLKDRGSEIVAYSKSRVIKK